MRSEGLFNLEKKLFNVVTVGSRDYYQVAIALKESGQLNRLITDFYTPDWLSGAISKRRDELLPSKHTVSLLFSGVLLKLVGKTRINHAIKFVANDCFGFVAALLTFLGPDRAIVYSYYLEGFVAFYRLIGRRPQTLICFQVHPTPWFINKIIAEDLERFGTTSRKTFAEDFEESLSSKDIQRYTSALRCCDAFVCASDVTRRSILDGQDLNCPISIVPYGSKLSAIAPITSKLWPADQRIRLLSVCQLTQRKGLHWAFKAMSEIDDTIATKFVWLVVSNKVDPAIRRMAPRCVEFISGLSNEELASLMAEADCFVMPSLIEGFGLVYIEALSMGTPIVYTANTGADDFCKSGTHGFRVEISEYHQLKNLFTDVAKKSVDLGAMRHDCKTLAQTISWERFRNGIRAAVNLQLEK